MSRGTLKYHTVAKVTNGVELTPANEGREVELEMSLTHWTSGKPHVSHIMAATYVGNAYDQPSDTVFAYFQDAVMVTTRHGEQPKPPKLIGESGIPLAFFR